MIKYPTRSDVNALAKATIAVFCAAEESGIDVWLCYGALLGMVREDRLLPWNNDAELACWYEAGIESKFKIITNSLNGMGYRAFYYSGSGVLNVYGGSGVVVNLNIFWPKNGLATRPYETASSPKAPFFGYWFYWLAVIMTSYTTAQNRRMGLFSQLKYRIKTRLVLVIMLIPLRIRKLLTLWFYKASQRAGGEYMQTGIPKEYFENMKKIEFYGGEIHVPARSEELLEYIYGDEWRIPKDNWSFYDKKNKSILKMKFIDEEWDYKLMNIV